MKKKYHKKCLIFFSLSTCVKSIRYNTVFKLINLKRMIEEYTNLLITVFEIYLLIKLICNKSRFLSIFSLHSLLCAVDFHLLGRSLFPDITVHLVFDERSNESWNGLQRRLRGGWRDPLIRNNNNNNNLRG